MVTFCNDSWRSVKVASAMIVWRQIAGSVVLEDGQLKQTAERREVTWHHCRSAEGKALLDKIASKEAAVQNEAQNAQSVKEVG